MISLRLSRRRRPAPKRITSPTGSGNSRSSPISEFTPLSGSSTIDSPWFSIVVARFAEAKPNRFCAAPTLAREMFKLSQHKGLRMENLFSNGDLDL